MCDMIHAEYIRILKYIDENLYPDACDALTAADALCWRL